VLATAPEAAHPLRGAARERVLPVWRDVFDDVGEARGWQPEARDLPDGFVRDTAPYIQRGVSLVVTDRRAAAALTYTAANDAPLAQRKLAARLRSAGGGAASAMWVTPPVAMPLRLGNEAFVMAARHRLGVGPVLRAGTAPCPCGRGEAAQPDHAMVCTLADATFRHDILVSTWRGIIRSAGCATSREPPYNRVAGACAGLKRGDIGAVLGPDRMVMADVVVTDACSSTALRRKSAQETGAAAAQAAKGKHDALGGLALADGNDFVALAHESHGRLGREALRLLQDLGQIAADSGRATKRAFVHAALCRLSVTLAKGVARMYTTACFAVARAHGHDFQPGLPAPCADLCGVE